MTTKTVSGGTTAATASAAAPLGAGAAIDGALAIAREWAGPGLEALVLSGSHAGGEGVWCEDGGRTWTLSDLDVYAVMADEAACAGARSRAHAGLATLPARMDALGIAAPLEVAFVTRRTLARMGARPGTLEFASRARVAWGDPGVLESAAHWTAADVPREERLLLLENRGFELLLAWPGLAAPATLERLRARHAVLKTAADLAAVLALGEGELPAGTRARVERAAAGPLAVLAGELPLEQQPGVQALPALWDAAMAWRGGRVELPPPAAAATEWAACARAWCAVWWHAHGPGPREPWARVLRVAARAPMRRRARQALLAASRRGASTPLGAWLRAALAGTPQHRANGSAAVLLLAAAMAPAGAPVPALPVGALRALRILDVTHAADWACARTDVVRAWDRWVLDGQRTAEAS